MAINFVDELMAYIAVPVNMSTFISTIGLAAYAGTSFTRRYGQNGFQVDSVTLGALDNVQFQELILDEPRITGTEQRTDGGGRIMFDLRYHRQHEVGWVDTTFTTKAVFQAHVVPGSLLLGPDTGVTQSGVEPATPPMKHKLKFGVSIATEAFTLNYPLNVYLFAAADIAPTADLRRIREIRKFLESDPTFLASLDGPPNQQPLLFTQIYPGDAATGTPTTQNAIAALFDADDILAAFFTVPA
jgi:hypothetical protein